MRMEGVTLSNSLILLGNLEKYRATFAGGFAEVSDSAQSLLCLSLYAYFLAQ